MLHKRYFDGVEVESIEIDKVKETLREIATKIRSERPLVSRILLFGSFSKGDFTPSSDVDLAIIVRETSRKFIERSDEFIDEFRRVPFDVNLLVYTEDEVKKMLSDGSALMKEIVQGVPL